MGAAPASPSSGTHLTPALALHVLRISRAPIVSRFGASAADITQNVSMDPLESIVARGVLPVLVVESSKTRENRRRTLRAAAPICLTFVSVVLSGDDGKVGLSMRIYLPDSAHDDFWQVLDVLEGSLTESAGLVPFGDWIVAWSGGPLFKKSKVYDIIEAVLRVRPLGQFCMIQD